MSAPLTRTDYGEFLDNISGSISAFVRLVLHATPEPWQLAELEYLDKGGTRLAIKSGHGVGKTTLLAWIIIHQLLTRYPQKTVVTAPTSGQLFDALAAEVKHWIRLLPGGIQELFDVKSDRIELLEAPEASFLAYRTSRQEQPESLQGVHSDHVLLVADEASGIPEAVYHAAGGSLSTRGARFILAGNPTRPEGYFYDLFRTQDEDWRLTTVSCFDSSRVDPKFIRMIANAYGEESNVYRVRVLGEFPAEADDKLIPFYLIETASKRDIAINPDWDMVWGLDVARSGKDRTALVKRKGKVVTEIFTKHSQDLMEITGWVRNMWETCLPSERPIEVCVDAIGLGAGVADRLLELDIPAVAVNVAENSALNPQAMRLRDDLWLQVRDWFMRQDVKIPDEQQLIKDLQAPSFAITSTGKYKVSSKDDMRRRGFKSPDTADALALTFAGDASVAMLGSLHPTRSSWNQPVELPNLGIV
jgi:hypothetical protein